MAIDRVDTVFESGEDKGWGWESVDGDMECLIISNAGNTLCLTSNGLYKHTVAPCEIEHWIKALTKAKEHFVGEGYL